jgi:NAD(P)H dehydrogenase (quinone)
MVIRRLLGLGEGSGERESSESTESGKSTERREMSAKVLIAYYSTYGHVHQMADAVEEGVNRVSGAEVRVRRFPEIPAAKEAMSSDENYQSAQQAQEAHPEVTHDDLRWADGIIWGTPTRYGNMTAQMKQFLDTTGSLWQNGELEDKATGIFTSTATIHGGQETTILTSLVPLIHLGMVFVGTPYGQNSHIMTTEGVGGSPYGPSTIADLDGSRQPIEDELLTARNLGERVAHVSRHMFEVRASRSQGQQPNAPVYTQDS